jgi:hypothetical protein
MTLFVPLCSTSIPFSLKRVAMESTVLRATPAHIAMVPSPVVRDLMEAWNDDAVYSQVCR